MKRTSKQLFSSLLVGALLASSMVPAASFAAQEQEGDKLGKRDRERLAEAQAEGRPEVTLLVATERGAEASVATGLAGVGGAVQRRDDDLGYIRVVVPTGKAIAASRLRGIEAVDVDGIIPIDDPRPEAASSGAVPPPGRGTPEQNPYMPTRDIGAPQFMAQNPTFDGRGVKIGILDTGIDLFTPELQTARTLKGERVRKIVDWVTYTDPLTDDDPTWVLMGDKVTAQNRRFTYRGVSYVAPGNGSYRVGLFDERDPRLGGELENDVNRDGNPAGSSGLFAVLWDKDENVVWVDANQDRSFADERPMADYNVGFDVGTFGRDNPSTAVRETVPFVVQTDPANDAVNIGIVSGAHGTHVAGIAAGKGFFDGAFDGAAPEAQIVSVRVCLFITGCTARALVEGMIYAVKTAKSDVVNMSIGGLPALNDGDNARAVIYNRLIDQYGAQMFISAGNSGPGINTVGDPSVASKVMSVGAYVHKDTWYANYGAQAAKTDGLFTFSSRGPREDGGFKPNIVAPGAAVSTIPAWQDGDPVPGTYPLPPGYGMFNGTSMAAPEATGGAALLLSAARQEKVKVSAERLRRAINSTSRYLPGYGALEQGNGLVQVGAAWALLSGSNESDGDGRRDDGNDLKARIPEITSSAPVNTVISRFLATPNRGQGIYEREGWAPGQSGERTITFTRTSGPGGSRGYNVRWVGNDGTFSSGSSIALPLNQPVAFTVGVRPATAGVHSAILNLDDPSSGGVEYQVMNVVVAAEQLNAANNFSVTRAGQADRPDKTTFFVNVPAQTPAFKVDLQAASGRVRLLRFHPYGLPFDSTSTTPYCTAPCSFSRTLSNPAAGVWELTEDTSRLSSTSPSSFTLSATLQGVDVSPASWVQDPARVGTSYSQSFSFTNRFGSFTGGAEGTPLGSAFAARPTIAARAPQQVYQVVVPAGSTQVSARIGGASDSGADLDLFLYDCTGASCVLKSSSTSGSSNEFVSARNPAPGTWKVVVDPYDVPSGSTAYDYLDLVANPSFGSVTVADAPAPRANGATWTANATARANAAPAAGRFLQGFVQVKSGSSVLGSAEVSLRNVAP